MLFLIYKHVHEEAYHFGTKIICEICSKLTVKTPERLDFMIYVVDLAQVNTGWQEIRIYPWQAKILYYTML